MDNKLVPVLSYESGPSGWNDELTEFHENEAGDDHYIDRASRLHAFGQIRKFLPKRDPIIMEIGCSSGYFLRMLKTRMPDMFAIGADYILAPLENLAHSLPGTPLLQFNLLTCPLPAASFDVLVLLNVLEHIEDDAAAAAQVFRLLRPGGIAVFEVPAGPHLFDIYDRQLMHYRRYKMPGLLMLLRAVGFEILERSHLGFLVYPGFYLVKKRNQHLLQASVQRQRAELGKNIQQSKNSPVFHWLMRVESKLREAMYLPAGIRCLVTARRPE